MSNKKIPTVRWDNKPVDMKIPLFGYMYDMRDNLYAAAVEHGISAHREGCGANEVLFLNGEIAKVKELIGHLILLAKLNGTIFHLQVVSNHSSGGFWISRD